MAKDRNTVDLLNGPVELARRMSVVQIQAFRGQFIKAESPLRQWMAQNGIRVKDISDART